MTYRIQRQMPTEVDTKGDNEINSASSSEISRRLELNAHFALVSYDRLYIQEKKKKSMQFKKAMNEFRYERFLS